MNSTKNVIQFIVASFLCLFLLSIIIEINQTSNEYLKNISILSDILPKKTTKNTNESSILKEIDTTALESVNKDFKDSSTSFSYFTKPHQISNCTIDTNEIVLPHFMNVLTQQISSAPQKKIRIAYLGDSMIEGDLVSQTLRKLLQQKFGGNGVGFVSITSLVANFRQTVKHSFSPNWIESNFKRKVSNAPLFLSGKVFNSKGYNWVEYEDKSLNYPIKNAINKYLITGYKPTNAQVLVNKIYTAAPSKQSINKIAIDKSLNTKIKIETTDSQLPFYGISFETEDGIIVDNLSFRGLAGFEYNNIDTNFLKSIQETFQYDLIIMQFGVNVLNLPTNNQFGWYQKSMINAISRLKYCFPNSEFLLIGAADKAFKYKNGYQTALGMDSLIAAQQKIAFATKTAFYNTYATMGGSSSMVKWVNQNPSFATKDYTHLTFKGSEFLGNSIYTAIMYEFEKASKNK